ncbi:hypothetical protein PMIN04_007524 [Paraphaeosphaeria minitans]
MFRAAFSKRRMHRACEAELASAVATRAGVCCIVPGGRGVIIDGKVVARSWQGRATRGPWATHWVALLASGATREKASKGELLGGVRGEAGWWWQVFRRRE